MFFWIIYLAFAVEGLNETAKRLRVDNEPYCRICGYNVRGLSRPQCPECGTELTTATIQRGRLLISPRIRKSVVGFVGAALAIVLLIQILGFVA